MQLLILGSNSAIPANGRFPTAQVLTVRNKPYLIDCGEGTQLRMGQFRVKRGDIDQIFISHLHGDHVFGLVPLLTSFSLNSRTSALSIYGPVGIREFVETQVRLTESKISYKLNIYEHSADEPQLIFENQGMSVHTIPLLHRLPTTGFLFREKANKLRNIVVDKIHEYQLSVQDIKRIKSGEDYYYQNENGQIICVPNAELTIDPPPPYSYAYCSDTAYYPQIINQIQGVDLLYHEATYLHDMLEWAERTKHSTALQAAEIAAAAGVGRLLLGHYSSRYGDVTPIQTEARSVFAESYTVNEGQVYDLNNPDE